MKTGVFEEEEENAVFLTIITRVFLYKEKHNLYNDKVKFLQLLCINCIRSCMLLHGLSVLSLFLILCLIL